MISSPQILEHRVKLPLCKTMLINDAGQNVTNVQIITLTDFC